MRFAWIILISIFMPSISWAQSGIYVRTEVLGELLVDFERKAPAEVRALNDSSISAEVSAVVLSVHTDVGKAVAKGDLLLELNPIDYQLNLKQAKANLASSQARMSQAKAKLARAKRLGDNQYISADELLERETEVMVSEAQIQADEVAVSIARRNLDKCSLRAPFDGVVGKRNLLTLDVVACTLDGVGQLNRVDGTENLSAFAGLGSELEVQAFELFGDGLRSFFGLNRLVRLLANHLVVHLHVGCGRCHSQALRDEEVACVSVLDGHHVKLAAEQFHVLLENDVHGNGN